MPSYPLSDLTLARRLERAEGEANAAFVDARATLSPDVHAGWIEVAGALAMFDGPASPLTQTFALGLAGAPANAELDAIESFFHDRGAAVHHEVSPLAGAALSHTLGQRGYHVAELTSVMYRPVDLPTSSTSVMRVDTITPDRADAWADTAAAGWRSEAPALEAFMRDIGRVIVRAHGTTAFLAMLDHRPIAAAALNISRGVALLSGASTMPDARKQGAQQALLHARVKFARAHGCDLAMMCAAPGSASQRNAERHGFRIAYTRTKWELE